MLINFTFENHKSFRNTQQFTMELDDVQGCWRVPGVSPVAAVYGANASGKSNFLDAIVFLSNLLRNGFSSDGAAQISVTPFLLDASSGNVNTVLFIEVLADDGTRYKYHIELNADEIVYESLSAYKSNRPSLLFERESVDSDDASKKNQSISFGASLQGPKKQVWSITRPNVPFLSAAAVSGNQMLTQAYEAIAKSISLYPARAYRSELARIKEHFAADDSVAFKLKKLIRCADFGIVDIRLTEGELDEEVLKLVEEREADPQVRQSLLDQFRKVYASDLVFKHEGKLGSTWMPSRMESEGTIAALAFLSAMIRVLESGKTALVDEVDQSLHPLLVRELVKIFVDPETNPKQAQLIFTTHDVSLINAGSLDRVLERDQVWLSQKDDSGISELIPITAYSPRKEDNLGRNYMNGVYDGLPLITLRDALVELNEGIGADAGEPE